MVARSKLTKCVCSLVMILLVGCQSVSKNSSAVEEKQKQWREAAGQFSLGVANEQIESGNLDVAKRIARENINSQEVSAEAFLVMARTSLLEGRYAKARKESLDVIGLEPTNAQAWYCLGVSQREMGDISAASKSFEKAWDLDPVNADYVIALARCYSYRGRDENAVEILFDQIGQKPEDASLKIAAADILFHSEKPGQAIELYEEAVEIEPENTEAMESLGFCYLETENWSKAVGVFYRLLENSKEEADSVKYLKVLATCSMNAKEYAGACNYYDRLTVIDSDNPELWLHMAEAALGAGDVQRALECSMNALEIKEDLVEAIAIKACALYMNKEYRAAIESFFVAAENEQYRGFSWLMIGRCHELMGQSTMAISAYKNAVGFNKNPRLVNLITSRR